MPMIASSSIKFRASSYLVMVSLQGPNLNAASPAADFYSKGSEVRMMECTLPMKWLSTENSARNSVS